MPLVLRVPPPEPSTSGTRAAHRITRVVCGVCIMHAQGVSVRDDEKERKAGQTGTGTGEVVWSFCVVEAGVAIHCRDIQPKLYYPLSRRARVAHAFMCNADTRESKENCRTVAVAVALNLSSILRISLALLTAHGSRTQPNLNIQKCKPGYLELSYFSSSVLALLTLGAIRECEGGEKNEGYLSVESKRE
ncbi:hypothetical protein KQX54_021240 [Cotesia glomerata]|uniref:Uncharacterized protein n=1 Tax=Cotesia glomerata TaxID=32391 RepID=A0AAV7J9R6_COTGL|nr:hypothetical protein KQX54_021240 [Cotesia glomerata]